MNHSTHTRTTGTVATALILLLSCGWEALGQIQKDDLVISVNSNTTDSFRIVRPDVDADPGVTVNGGVLGMATPWSENFIETVEFDNAHGVLHNAHGNMLGADFGNSFVGFELTNFATDGSDAKQLLWSIKTETAGARTDRGAGISASPDNTKVAWGAYDGGKFHVLQYDAGTTPGSGAGASVTGWIETAQGDGAGNTGVTDALMPSATAGTTWLDNNTVLAFSGFGDLVSLDTSGIAFGTTSAPATTSAWVFEKSGILTTNATWTDLEYNPKVAPGILIGSASSFSGASKNEIFVWDKDTFNQIAKIDVSTSSQTAREIALDSKGNLYIGGFGNQIVSVIDDFVAKVAAGTLTDNSSVLWYTNDFFASFSGLDVATTNIPGDVNNDGYVDIFDVNLVSAHWSESGPVADANLDGTVDIFDINLISANWSPAPAAAAASSVPEPSSLVLATLCGLTGLCAMLRRRSA